jgi:hypothetical protein
MMITEYRNNDALILVLKTKMIPYNRITNKFSKLTQYTNCFNVVYNGLRPFRINYDYWSF